MNELLRAVLDTNILLASQLTRSVLSPNRELLQRFSAGDFLCLYSDDVIDEYLRKLTEHGIEEAIIISLVAAFVALGTAVPIEFFSPAPLSAGCRRHRVCTLCAERQRLTSRDL